MVHTQKVGYYFRLGLFASCKIVGKALGALAFNWNGWACWHHPGETCLVLSIVNLAMLINSPSYILLTSLAGTGHGLHCIFDMNNIYGVGILEMVVTG